MKWFYSRKRWVQIALLLIPVVNWIVEICIRWSNLVHKGGFLRLCMAILVLPAGIPIGWLDCIWVFLFRRITLEGRPKKKR